ncbi:MAG: hypothetical protein JNM69_39180 [Archangium sp.]|nr:hypothetical protein [Archangium sp.]
MRRWVALLFVSSACVTTRPPPLGLAASQDAIAKAERQAKLGARFREVGGTLAGIAAGIGGVVLLGSQLQPTQSAATVTDPSLAGLQTAAERAQQFAAENKARDRTIAASVLIGSVVVFLGACVASAIVDDGASEWLAEQRARELADLTPSESEANSKLLEAALAAQKLPAEPGHTLKPRQR